MKEKLKAIFDSPALWATVGGFAGTVLGAKAGAIVSAIGSVVMAVL